VAVLVAGLKVDCLEFARLGRNVAGELAFADLPRLADMLFDSTGCLTVNLDGYRDNDGKSWLDLRISGAPVVYCQRCLGGVAFKLDIKSRLQLIAHGAAWPDDELFDDSCDAIAADAELDFSALVEDEVLLALPIAPMHEACESPGAVAHEHGLSPFAALAAFKKH